MTTYLIGGGWDPAALTSHLRAVLGSCSSSEPEIALVLIDEGPADDGDDPADADPAGDDTAGAADRRAVLAYAQRYVEALHAAGPCRPRVLAVPIGEEFDPAALGEADVLFVCGGLTPAYLDALAPVAGRIRSWLRAGRRHYVGFSAGAAAASRRSIAGGWLDRGRPVCPEEAGEDLDEVTVVDGLGLVPFTIDAHCAQWGTLPRLVAALVGESGPAGTPASGRGTRVGAHGPVHGPVHGPAEGVGIDEGTMLTVDVDGSGVSCAVTGVGQAWWARSGPDGVVVTPERARPAL